MTIGKNSRKSSVRSSIRAPKFLDKSSGFYGRLDEPEAAGGEEEVKGNQVEERWSGMGGDSHSPSPRGEHISGPEEEGEVELFHLDEGMMEDDGETLLQRKQSRRSSRWRRSSRRRNEGRVEEEERADLGSETPGDQLKDARLVSDGEMDREEEEGGRPKEPTLLHFPIRSDADDQVLIREKKRGRKEEEKQEEEEKKMVKRSTVKNYHKALNRALRRGWETFITNLYSVTLTPVTSSSSPPSSSPSLNNKQQHNSILAEFQ